MRAAAVQFAPVYLDTAATLAKMLDRISAAAQQGAQLIAFPETALSGYPGWLAHTGGARFDDAEQKAAYACYLDAAVEADGPEVAALVEAARDHGVQLIVGITERGTQRARGSNFATLLHVPAAGAAATPAPILHRKLVPTYEERLVWAHGDAAGLQVLPHEPTGLRVGALNCWENWMPLSRAALYQQGEEVHVSIWPGSPELTRDISRFGAREGRVFIVAASGVLHAEDVPAAFPLRDAWVAARGNAPLHSGGSRIVAPDGRELAQLDDPVEGIVVADLEPTLLRAERQNFDPAGHYARPELMRLEIDSRPHTR